MEILLLLLAFFALSSAFPLDDLHIEKKSDGDSGSEVPDVYKVAFLYVF